MLKALHDKRYTWQWQPGSDPGVDVHRAQTELYESSLTECKITIVDYCKEKVQVSPTLTNDDLEAYLRKPRGSWSKVRWINVEGLSYNVICTLALEFNLHPLAVEDILHIPQRTKVDRYPSALYASIILHAACPHEELNQVERTRSFLTEHMFGDQRTPRIKAVKDFEVTVEQASLFLLPNGTVLTFFQHEGELVCQPIFKRLQGDGTILRTSEDASLLVQAVLDAAVDHAFLVVNAYRNELFELEGNVLARPHAQLTKDLHLLTGELNQFKRTFMPTLALIRSLRENTVVDGADWHISNLARVYLSDVQDHCTVINDDLSDLITLADNLINLASICVYTNTGKLELVLMCVHSRLF
ncbi:hypothetical protein BDF22DRAFT_267618 [Syncephalis plumigaleata]|nr:hypothetical protein BDF22DRAFT_267618 [Syncephalis plumigaleata]